MKIYTVKEFNTGTCEYFVNLNAVAEYLKSKSPIDDKFTVRDRDTESQYDITAEERTDGKNGYFSIHNMPTERRTR